MRYLVILLTFIIFGADCSAGSGDSAPELSVLNFYKTYFVYLQNTKPGKIRPTINLSHEFSDVIKEADAACKKYADYPCGWGADGDEYLDAQEYDPKLNSDSSHITVKTEINGYIHVEFNVYPSINSAGNYYARSIDYKMLKQGGEWVVDDIFYSDKKSTKNELVNEAREARASYMERRGRKIK